MHGLGNDFVVINGTKENFNFNTQQIQEMSDRYVGIGFDQLLLITSPIDESCDFHLNIYNADGKQVEQCGNGMRCVARYIKDKNLSNKNAYKIESAGRIIETEFQKDEQVRVNMGPPQLEPKKIPFLAEEQDKNYVLTLKDQEINFAALSMGNPHAVIVVDDISDIPIEELGAEMNEHPSFPQGVNVGFMQISKPNQVQLRVYERGVGETFACGSGACAALVAGRIQGLLDETVTVNLPGGALEISWEGDDKPVWMLGPTVTVFEGEYSPPNPI